MGLSSSKNDEDIGTSTNSVEYFSEDCSPIELDYDMQFFLSLSTVIIKAENCARLFRKTVMFPDDYSHWRVTLVMHYKLVNYIVNNNLLAKVVINNVRDNSHRTFSSRLLDAHTIGSTDFASYNFYCECPIEEKNRYSVCVELENYKHHLFDIKVENHMYDEDDCESYYDIFTHGFCKFNGDDFTKYWSLCSEDISNISKVTHYFIKKNNINEEHILYDPWFALLSICDKDDKDELISNLKLLNGDVDWEKLYDISVDFYSKYKYEAKHIKKGLQKIPSIVGSTASGNKDININVIGYLSQIALNYMESIVLTKHIY